MRMLLVTVLLAFVLGACGLVFDSKTSSTEYPPDAGTTDDGQHDGGFGDPPDGGCNQVPDAHPGNDGGGYWPDAGWPTPDGGILPPDGATWPNADGGIAPPDGAFWPDAGP
jgi:hypothetical protein